MMPLIEKLNQRDYTRVIQNSVYPTLKMMGKFPDEILKLLKVILFAVLFKGLETLPILLSVISRGICFLPNLDRHRGSLGKASAL